ncbi:hypothetical protein DACRYDRAFT_21852 [Dacryopinax primogenitus]|uniref:Aminoglycoside phosphotransferase domain-containing protein n=1 Tax=Dacryopinax primogenitus (strain DJM 731) TaxID=1858805 RepID=M5G3Z3_DACPD|nr:uncharacterized protein DACRYDRAFT_21852 [Dacryopinax primogenitus]EJU02930.1 hypothetical protein DACRYDRAFT_21852 [Dacryopinax primogenitus]
MMVMFAPPALRSQANFGEVYRKLRDSNSARVDPPITDPIMFPDWVRAYLDHTVPPTPSQSIPPHDAVDACVGPRLVSVGSPYGGHRVVRVAENVLVKANMPYASSEASTMRYVAARTSIRIPRFFGGDQTRIMMEEVGGCNLDTYIARMTPTQLHELSHLLKRYLDDLHGLKFHNAQLGQVDGQPFRNQTFGVGVLPSDAFQSLQAFNEWLDPLLVEALGSQGAADVIARLPKMDGRFLIHGDLQPKNIMVHFSNPDSSRSSMEIAIIDWGSAAIFPSRSWEWAGMVWGIGEMDYGGKWHVVLRTICPDLGEAKSPLRHEVDAVLKVRGALSSFS